MRSWLGKIMGKRRSLDPEKLLAEFEENGVPSPEKTERKTPEQIEVEAIAQVIEKLRDKGHTERGVFDYLRDRGLGVKSFKTFQKHNPVNFSEESQRQPSLPERSIQPPISLARTYQERSPLTTATTPGFRDVDSEDL